MERRRLLTSLPGEPAERAAVGWSFTYFFALLAGYYVLRPIRDEIGVQIGSAQLQHLFTAVFVVLLLVVPVFGALNRRWPRRRLLPWLYGFFAANLVGFFVLFEAGGTQAPWLARVFFVWVSVYNLFVVSVFWSFMADLWDTRQAERLYGFIAAGGTLGAMAGPSLTALLVGPFGAKGLMLVSAALLGVAIVAILRLRAWARAHAPAAPASAAAPDVGRDPGTALPDDGERRALGGGLWSGIVDVLRSPYLLGICAFLFMYTLLSTLLYFIGVEWIGRAIADSAARTRLLAQVDLATNVLALLLQLVAFRALLQRAGTRVMLVLLPLVSVAGFAALAAAPQLGVLIVFGVLRRAGEYALTKPTRETLFNGLTPEQKYKAKNVIDTVVYRGGDTISAWAHAGLRSLGAGPVHICWIAVPLALAWAAIGWGLGGRAERRRRAAHAQAAPSSA